LNFRKGSSLPFQILPSQLSQKAPLPELCRSVGADNRTDSRFGRPALA